MRADYNFREAKHSRLVMATMPISGSYSAKEDLKKRARVLDRMVAAKAERKNIQMLTPSRLVSWSRVEKTSTSNVPYRAPLAKSPRFFQGREEPLPMDYSRTKTLTVMGGTSNKWPAATNATRSIYIKTNNPYRINLTEFEPCFSRTVKNEANRQPVKTDAGTPSIGKSRSCSKQKISLSNKTKSMNFNFEGEANNSSWLEPILSFFGGTAVGNNGCSC